jgi:hypothetical protein
MPNDLVQRPQSRPLERQVRHFCTISPPRIAALKPITSRSSWKPCVRKLHRELIHSEAPNIGMHQPNANPALRSLGSRRVNKTLTCRRSSNLSPYCFARLEL